MRWGRIVLRVLLCLVAVAVTALQPPAYAERPTYIEYLAGNYWIMAPGPLHTQNARVVLSGVPDDIIPNNSNKWNCTCDSDGCWPGCFTVASASILSYWSQKGYPNLWNGDANATLIHLRELFPNMLCDGNGNGNGKPGDTTYDAFDVASGLVQYTLEKGYSFTITPIVNPTFDKVMAEIDAGRPVIGSFAESPWGSHAGTIVGYDTTNGHKIMVVRPNLWQRIDTDLEWGLGYQGLGLITLTPNAISSPQEGATAAAPESAPQATPEITVNAGDPGFATQGQWQEAPGVGINGSARSQTTTDPSNLGPKDDTAWARWSPDLPFDGMWEVLAWMPLADSDDSVTHNAVYHVNHAEGGNLVRRSQHAATQGWMSLGTFPFARGNKGNVQLGNLTGDVPLRKVWADAVKFVWRAPLIVTGEEDNADRYLVQNGKRQRIPDDETFAALRLSRSNIRKLSDLALAQYPAGNPIPSVFSGWVGQYFNNTTLAQPASAVRGDPSLNFQWNGAAPAANMSSLGFSTRWSRRMAFTEGNYPFKLDATGSVRLYVDGQLQIDGWEGPNILIQHQRSVTLTSGLHLVEVEYANLDGDARITLNHLPPNVPLVIQPQLVQWTSDPTVTLRWHDSGDPENTGKSNRFYVGVWREEDGWSTNSDWITTTSWTMPLVGDGHYFWRVSASNGTAVSDWSQAVPVWVDRTPPWAQMMPVSAAAPPTVVKTAAATTLAEPVTTTNKPIPAEGSVVGELPDPATAAVASHQAVPLSPATLGVHLTWWTTDTLSGVASFDVQARELVHASLHYTPAIEMKEITQLSYELVLSGSDQITNTFVITSLVPYTTVAPIMLYTPVTPSTWLTFATGIVNTETLFIGNPGSTYEFRVRARDNAGNAQDWYDGYSVQAQVDPTLQLRRLYLPLLQN